MRLNSMKESYKANSLNKIDSLDILNIEEVKDIIQFLLIAVKMILESSKGSNVAKKICSL